MSEKATDRVLVKASLQRCFDVAIDFESYPEWSSDIAKVDVVKVDESNRPLIVRFWAEAIGRTTEYTLQYDYSAAPDHLVWSLVEGDIENAMDGEYFFHTLDGDTEITYTLTVELKVPMPGFVKRRAENRILGSALQELKQRAES